MHNLPKELIQKIYEYDPTFHILYRKVLSEIPKISIFFLYDLQWIRLSRQSKWYETQIDKLWIEFRPGTLKVFLYKRKRLLLEYENCRIEYNKCLKKMKYKTTP